MDGMIKRLFYNDQPPPQDNDSEERKTSLGENSMVEKGNQSSGNTAIPNTKWFENYNCTHCEKKCKSSSGFKLHLKACKRNLVIKTPENTRKIKEVIAGVSLTETSKKENIKLKSTTQSSGVKTLENHYETTVINRNQAQIKIWGDHTLDDVIQIFNATYDEVVHWRRNLFLLPTGAAGKRYITETIRLIEIWNQQVDLLKGISIKAVMTMPMLLLQKPSYKSKAKDHSECLNRRLNLWVEGRFDDLMRESRTIQSKIPKPNSLNTPEQCAKNFAKLMLQGKIHAALRLLDDKMSGGVLDLTDETLQELRLKHPNPVDADESVLLKGEIPFIDPAIYNNIDETTILKAAFRTKGSAGPSGMNSDGWRRILVSKNFGKIGVELRSSLARFAKNLCTTAFDHTEGNSLEAYIACRLIPLDKKPGVRPIGVGEVL